MTSQFTKTEGSLNTEIHSTFLINKEVQNKSLSIAQLAEL